MQGPGQLQTGTLPGRSAFLEASALLPYLDLFSWPLRVAVGSLLPGECALSKMNFTSPPPATREAPSSHELWGAIAVLPFTSPTRGPSASCAGYGVWYLFLTALCPLLFAGAPLLSSACLVLPIEGQREVEKNEKRLPMVSLSRQALTHLENTQQPNWSLQSYSRLGVGVGAWRVLDLELGV